MQSFVALLALVACAVANPLPTPAPSITLTASLTTTDSWVLSDAETSPTCTTYLTSYIRGFQGDFEPSIEKTVYTTTKTDYTYIDCKGCYLSIVTTRAPNYGGLGPVEIVTGTTTASEPFVTTATLCRRSLCGAHDGAPLCDGPNCFPIPLALC